MKFYQDIKTMKALAKNQYQLLAIVDIKPLMPESLIRKKKKIGLFKMKNISGAVTFAVTIQAKRRRQHHRLETNASDELRVI